MERRDLKVLQPLLEQWVKKEGYALLGETWYEPEAAAVDDSDGADAGKPRKKRGKADATVRLEKTLEEALQTGMHTNQRLSSKLLAPFVAATSSSSSSSSSPSPVVLLAETRPFAYLLNFLLMCVHFWKPLGKDVDEAADEARERAFLQMSRDLSFSELHSLTEATVERARTALAAFKASSSDGNGESGGSSNLEAAAQLLDGKLKQVAFALEIMREFDQAFSKTEEEKEGEATAADKEQEHDKAKEKTSETPEEKSEEGTEAEAAAKSPSNARYAATFFAAVHAIQDQAVQDWAWAEALGSCLRDLALWEALLNWAKEEGRATSPRRLVVLCENNQAIAVSEMLTRIGFVCRGFSGTLERVSPYQKLSPSQRPPEAFDQRFLTKMLATAMNFPRTTDDVSSCGLCGRAGSNLNKCSRCLAVAYCGPDCQKQHWKVHKADCKPADPAVVAAAKAKAQVGASGAGTSDSKAGKKKGKR